MMIFVLSSLMLAAQNPRVGEWKQNFVSQRFSSSREAGDFGFSTQFKIKELSILLHPEDPFANPSLKWATDDSQGEFTLYRGGSSAMNPEWVDCGCTIQSSSTSLENSKVDRSLNLTLQINRVTGEARAKSLKASYERGDGYHPFEEKSFSYRSDD